jgi:UDP-GlcNAc:undecaprenyl-phosphate GlcNAc-1-phosphate transferase
MGGVAIYGGVLCGMFVAHQLPVLRTAFDFSNDPWGVIVAGGVIVLVGAIDDRFELDSLTKLAGQVTAAGILVLFGLQWMIAWVPWDGGATISLDQNQGALLTVLLAVTMINAMNFVDGLDGLAAGIGLIAAAATCAFSIGLLVERQGAVEAYPPALIAAALAGACLGFLPHNFNPARIFMGDSGSMVLGLTIAAAAIIVTGQIDPEVVSERERIPAFIPIVLPVMVVAIPLVDMALAVLRRMLRGESPFAPDAHHLHHRLLRRGHSHRWAVGVLYLWTFVLSFGTVSLVFLPGWTAALLIGCGIAIACVVTYSERTRLALTAQWGKLVRWVRRASGTSANPPVKEEA